MSDRPQPQPQAAAGALAGMVSVLSPELCGSHVVPALERLASDRVWAARKAAAGALPRLASAAGGRHCPLALRLLAALLGDASAWVRGAALLAGGPVLSCARGLPISEGTHRGLISKLFRCLDSIPHVRVD